ncbi:MAG: hypothetical protein N2257_03640 [Thermodesulfovibrionales bacterium]|nr:hypothetical protein [Thermodesulfovibrionales bacterium]
MKRLNILTIILLIFGSVSLIFGLTDHREFAKMELRDCKNCHRTSGVPETHGSFWFEEHRIYAEKYPNNCKDCHDQSFCLDCHTGGGIDRDLHVSTSGPDYMPKTHRTDFREIHPIKAMDDPRSCYRCHDARKFCNECHSKFRPADLRILSHRRGFSEIEVSSGGPKHSTFTPAQCQVCHPNSLLPKHQWSSAHAREARKNLISCQTCHPDGDVCLKCHSAKTGLRINPHPEDWGKIKNRLRDASNERTCIKCH